jgi:hypothetical protein
MGLDCAATTTGNPTITNAAIMTRMSVSTHFKPSALEDL